VTYNSNVFQTSNDCRKDICSLGEICSFAVIAQFDSRRRRQADEANLAVVEFFNLQLSFHNPEGAVTKDDGAWYETESVWVTCLHRIYGNLIDSTITNGLRNLRTKKQGVSGGGVDIFRLDEDMTRLSAAVLHQLFVRNEVGGRGGNFTTTQIVPLNTTQFEGAGGGGSAAKKRRVVSAGIEDLLEHIRKGGGSDREEQREAVPWLQVLREMLVRFPTWLLQRKEAYLLVFKCVVNTLQSCKLQAGKSLLIACCDILLSIEDRMALKEVASQTGKRFFWLKRSIIDETCFPYSPRLAPDLGDCRECRLLQSVRRGGPLAHPEPFKVSRRKDKQDFFIRDALQCLCKTGCQGNNSKTLKGKSRSNS
jgi:hypothetical protein